jgi:hypothetical protein
MYELKKGLARPASGLKFHPLELCLPLNNFLDVVDLRTRAAVISGANHGPPPVCSGNLPRPTNDASQKQL